MVLGFFCLFFVSDLFSHLRERRQEPVQTTVQNHSGPLCCCDDGFQVEDGGFCGGGRGSDDRFAAVGGLGLLQFALTEGLDGAQQGGTTSPCSIRGGQRRRRTGRGVQHRRGRRRRRRGRSSLGSWIKQRKMKRQNEIEEQDFLVAFSLLRGWLHKDTFD